MSFEVLNQNWSFKFNEQRIRTALIVTPLKKFPTALVNFAKMCLKPQVPKLADIQTIDKWITDDGVAEI